MWGPGERSHNMAGAGLYYGQDITALTSGNTKKTESYTIEIDGYGDFEMNPGFFELSKDKQDAIVAEIIEYQKTRIDVETGGDYRTKGEVLAEQGGSLAGGSAGFAMAPVFPHPLATVASKGIGAIAGSLLGEEATRRGFNALQAGDPDSKLVPDPQILMNSMDF